MSATAESHVNDESVGGPSRPHWEWEDQFEVMKLFGLYIAESEIGNKQYTVLRAAC